MHKADLNKELISRLAAAARVFSTQDSSAHQHLHSGRQRSGAAPETLLSWTFVESGCLCFSLMCAIIVRLVGCPRDSLRPPNPQYTLPTHLPGH